MKSPFDDTLPEEGEPQYEELTTLLQQAYSKPASVTPDRQAQILARVRERLMQTDQGDSLNGNLLVPVSAFIEKSANEDQEDSLNGNLVVPQPGVLNSSTHQAESPAGKPRRDRRRFRLMALLAAAMIIAVLLGTPLLLLRPWHPSAGGYSTGGYNHTNNTPAGPPTLTLSPNVATIGTTIQLAIKNFTPSTSVALTHDIQEPIPIDGGSSIISVGPEGSANVDVSIDSEWGTGFHLIVAEDLKTRYTASATLLIMGSATQAYASFVATNGIMFGFDAQHTHFNPFEHILNPTTVGGLTKQWAYWTGGTVFSSPAVAGGVVYVGADDGYMYALNAATGAKQWAYWTGGSQVTNSPAVVGGVVYFGSEDGNVYALDAATGAKKWAYHTGNSIISSPAVVGGIVYVGSEDGNVYAFDAATGAKKWAYWTGGSPVDSSPAVAGGVVYVGSSDGNVYALDAATGAKKWAYHTGNSIYSSPAVVGGVVYVGSGDGNVYALNAATGAKKWAYHTGSPVEASPAVANGVVYVGSHDGTLYALNAATGAKQWTYRTRGPMNSPPTVANSVVYVGSGDGNLYAFDAATGAKQWAYQTGEYIYSSPAVANGVVYAGAHDENGYVYAFHLPRT